MSRTRLQQEEPVRGPIRLNAAAALLCDLVLFRGFSRQILTAAQPARRFRRLQHGAAGWGVRRQIASNRDQDTIRRWIFGSQFVVQCHAGLEHLVGMELSILAQEQMTQLGDQGSGIVAEGEVAVDDETGGLDLLLSVEEIA